MPSRDHRGRSVLAAGLLLAATAVGCSDPDPVAERQAQVADRGAEVMPFDLDATTHIFTNTDDGGIQVVTADDPADQYQIDAIREHLTEERERFARGDFDDPATIHGHDMPGVADLTTGYTDVVVTYVETPGGAQLTYATDVPRLVDAIHAWFDRQLMDHGDDAEAG
jgi:hypothetical protein